MIYVDRSAAPAPERLVSVGEERAAILREEFETSKFAQRDVSFDSNIYAGNDVLAALGTLFRMKCAFCESPLAAIRRENVEHFRPKLRAADLAGKTANAHYFWLAYVWDNLYLSCLPCRKHKGPRFPVQGRRAAIGALGKALHAEHQILLDPCSDRPEEHLVFDRSGRVEPNSVRGRTTIEVFALNRPDLVSARRKHALAVQARLKTLQARKARLEPLDDSRVLPPRGRQQYQALTRQLLLEATSSRAAAHPRRHKRSAPERTSTSIWLDRIEIENFRALQHLQLQFPRLDSTWAAENLGSDDQEPWLVLLGNNGIGKSSILKALALALASPEERTRLVPDQRQLVTQGRGQRQGRVRLWFSDQRLPHEWVFGHGVKSRVAKSRAPIDMPVLGYGSTRLLPAASTAGATPKKFRSGSLFAPTEPLTDAEPWFASASAVKRDPFNLAATDLKTLLSMDVNESLLRRRGQLWAHLYRKRLPVRELSDGFQSVLALALDLLFHFSASSHDPRAVEALVLIDEIEVHLHPTWKLRIVRDLRRIFRRARFIVTTHDPLCVQGLARGELHVLTRDERSRAVHVRQADVPLGLRADQVLTGEWFGMGSTRDPDTRRLMTRHAELLRVGDPTGAQQEEQGRIEGVLRERLGRFGESPYERAGLQAYAELAPRIEKLSPEEQQKRLQKRIRELLPMQR